VFRSVHADIVVDMNTSPAPTSRPPHYLYACTRPGTIHLVDSDNAARWANPAPLCGTGAGQAPLRLGDETLSGTLATCGRCRRIAGLPRIGH